MTRDASAVGAGPDSGRPSRPDGIGATIGWWLLSVAVAVLHNGLWATPNLGFISLIAENPGTNPFPPSLAGDYLLTSISMPTLAALTAQSEPHEVARLHLVVLLVGWASVVALAHRNHGARAARSLTVVLAAAPVVTVSMQWLGQPDPLTAMCGIAIVLVRRLRWVVPLGVLAGLTHPEQALFMALAAGLLRTALPGRAEATDPRRPRAYLDAAVALGSVVVGRMATEIWFRLNDITILNPRSGYLDYGLASFWSHHTREPVALLWSLWGPLWLLAAWLVLRRMVPGARDAGRSVPARAVGLAAAVAAVALVPTFVTLDATRVYAVVTAPLLGFSALWIARLLPRPEWLRVAAVLLAVTAVVPGVMSTGSSSTRGDLDTSEMLSFLRDGTVPREFRSADGEVLVTEWLIAPFDIVTDDPGG